ncbi:hypothetical protein QQ054_22180 [Oscillatoria amoena NRMC-F 0135]|nr:hypothetical protein [Oscillatoria amoena NRMC-F 0135]
MKKLLPLLLLAILAISCQKTKEAETPPSPSFEVERNAFFGNLKAPIEVAAQLQATAAEFNASLLNSPTNAGSYTVDEVKAAANLGVYLSDLNYSVAYRQTANTKEMFTAAHQLSKVIGVEQNILDYLMKRYETNLNQNDSAKAVLDELFSKATEGLKGTEREKLIGIAMSAYQIENLHLALGVIESYPKDMLPTDARTRILIPVFRLVLSQQQNVETIYGFFKSITDPTNPEKNPNYLYYSNAFEELIALYQKLNVDDKIANNQGLELMNDEVVKELSAKVGAIREKIVSL